MTLLQAGAGEQQEQKGQAAQEAEASAPVQTPEASKPSKAAKAQTSVLGKRKKGNAADEEPVAAPPERLDLMAAGLYPALYHLVVQPLHTSVMVAICTGGQSCLKMLTLPCL